MLRRTRKKQKHFSSARSRWRTHLSETANCSTCFVKGSALLDHPEYSRWLGQFCWKESQPLLRTRPGQARRWPTSFLCCSLPCSRLPVAPSEAMDAHAFLFWPQPQNLPTRSVPFATNWPPMFPFEPWSLHHRESTPLLFVTKFACCNDNQWTC